MSMPARPITIAISALGGQGGGVLSDWIRELAERNGYYAQSTSVPGVAQRTGATVYYLELFPEAAAREAGREPVLSLSAVAGDVDIAIAAEWMEAGRAIDRGFVTPDRTVLIASTHRAFAVAEKTAMGDGIARSEVVMDAARAAAKRLICFDMQRVAEECGAVISATLFGALGASGALPFTRADFEAVAGGGKAAQTNLRAFAAAWAAVESGADANITRRAASLPADSNASGALPARIAALPGNVGALAREGCRQLVDYQDARYAALYLDRLERVLAADRASGGDARDFALTAAVARHLALWMAYQDVIRVADQKRRGTRLAGIRREVRAADDQLVHPVEFMHPRLDEICDLLPRALGAAIAGSPSVSGWLGRFFRKGRHVRTYSLTGFLLLFALASLRPWRRGTLRHAVETARIEDWLQRIVAAAGRDYGLALEITRCQRLLKGYSSTQERGWHRFSRIMEYVARAPASADTACAVERLHAAALAGEDDAAFEAALAELAT